MKIRGYFPPMRHIFLKNMAILYCSFGVYAFGGISYFETVSSTQATQTKNMILRKKEDIKREIDDLKTKIETNNKCALERIRLLVGIVALSEKTLLDRKAFLHELRSQKRILEKKSLKMANRNKTQ